MGNIVLNENSDWNNLETRPACKYSPVIVDKKQDEESKTKMKNVLEKRKSICKKLGINLKTDVNFYSFYRGDQLLERNYRPNNVPIVVLSGGASGKIKQQLNIDLSLAWHPMAARGEPVYLFVHKLDFDTYATTLGRELSQYKNLFLAGWDGEKMSGFGAARMAALHFAESLSYRPQRFLMMDQDVISTEATRPSNPSVEKNIIEMHNSAKDEADKSKKIIGYGVGYPTREAIPKLFSIEISKPLESDKKSPTQQFVSIQAPFVNRKAPQLYPEFMVAGGEDMLMTLNNKSYDENGINQSVRNERILKMDLGKDRSRKVGVKQSDGKTITTINKVFKAGDNDANNLYWNQKRVETLKVLYNEEKDTNVELHSESGIIIGLQNVCVHLLSKTDGMKNDEINRISTSALIIERIIIRYVKNFASV